MRVSQRTLLHRSCAVLGMVICQYAASAVYAQSFRCSAKPAAGTIRLTQETAYSAGSQQGGWDVGSAPETFTDAACGGTKAFFFSSPATDGNYRVTLVLGGTQQSITTVRAESRRLMVKELHVAAKGSATVVFNVHIRTATIAEADPAVSKVRLKPREIGALDWDDKLTLEFNGDHPSVRSIAIERVDKVPTVYLAGDSTVVDQDKEPWAAWGQMLPAFFGAGVAIANEAESGETIKSFMGERRLAKIESTWKPGDYLLVQFAHNDQKPGNGLVPVPEYKEVLRRYIADALAHGVTPILVTSMNRRSFSPDGKILQTLGEYPQASRDIAAEQKVALIDLNAMSKTLFEAMGETGTLHAFVHYPANTFAGQTEELKDDTHFNSYGAYELAKCVVESIREQRLPLAKYLRAGVADFNPARPDSFDKWTVPPSPSVSAATPYGR